MEQKIETITVSFKELREGELALPDDKYGIAAYILTPTRVKSLLECPFVTDDEATCAMYFVIVDGVVAGRESYFTTRIKVGDKVLDVESASAFEVEEPYRHLGIGADIIMASFVRSKLLIGGGVSPMALPLDRKLKFHVLEFPRLMMLKNSRSVLETKHLGWLSGIVNLPLRLNNKRTIRKANKLAKKYEIKKVEVVPDWVDDIVLNDGHKYAEYHNHKWLQWNLDNNFRGLPQDNQSFYCVYKDGEPLGFYMIKERFRKQAGGVLNNVLIGSLVEWGSKEEKELSEADILLLSLRNYSPNMDIIETATSDESLAAEVRKYGFVAHGKANIVFKDRTKAYGDASDIKNWRVRYGYADVILT